MTPRRDPNLCGGLVGKGLYVRDPAARKGASAMAALDAIDADWALVNVAYPETCKAVASKRATLVYALPEKFDDGLGSIAPDEWRRTALRLCAVADAANAYGVCLNLERGWALATPGEIRELVAWLVAEGKRRVIVIATHDGLRRKFAPVAAECSRAGIIASPECYDHQIATGGYRPFVETRIADWRAAGWTSLMPSVGSIPAPSAQNDARKFAAFWAETNGHVGYPAAIWPVSTSSASIAAMRAWMP